VSLHPDDERGGAKSTRPFPRLTINKHWLKLLPLGLLLFTGLYSFVLPYATKWRQTQ
jgi:hypothetical protein